jgi:hypothetical protein
MDTHATKGGIKLGLNSGSSVVKNRYNYKVVAGQDASLWLVQHQAGRSTHL